MKFMNLRQAVVFGILMQNNSGVSGKSPKYIMEKAELCSIANIPETILDAPNRGAFYEFAKKWSYDWNTERDQKIEGIEIDPKTGVAILDITIHPVFEGAKRKDNNHL